MKNLSFLMFEDESCSMFQRDEISLMVSGGWHEGMEKEGWREPSWGWEDPARWGEGAECDEQTVVFIGTTLTLQVAGEPGSQGSALGGRRLKFASKGKEERVRHLLLLLSMLSS